ncbi:MAG: 3-dehydroquinate synthase [Bacteroidota bacterium]
MEPIIFSIRISDDLYHVLEHSDFSKCAIIVDEHTKQHCYPIVEKVLPENHKVIQIKSGEEFKTLDSCEHIWNELTESEFDRNGLVINLGGGVITDMGGFCAATFKRGISFINIPTTLLAQVDASVGGKLGIDFKGFKNHIGLFKSPKTTIISTEFLQTLSAEEVLSGKAEMLKHGLIKNSEHWAKIRSLNHDIPDLSDVEESVQIKKEVVLEDPEEKGLRKILNFGHTVGHAIETFRIDRGEKLYHGYCVAIGMICESYISYKANDLQEQELNEIVLGITSLYELPKVDTNSLGNLIQLMKQDKKNTDGQISFVLLSEKGKSIYNQKVSNDLIHKSIEYYNSVV